MKSTNFLIVIALSTMLFNACNQAPVATEPAAELDLDQIKTEIQALETGYATALNAGDVDGVMAYYSDDIVSYTNNEPTTSGKEALRKQIEDQIANTAAGSTTTFEVVDIFANGDLVVETGKSTVKDSVGTVTRTGKYMCLFMKKDDKYECIREMYNNDSKE